MMARLKLRRKALQSASVIEGDDSLASQEEEYINEQDAAEYVLEVYSGPEQTDAKEEM